MSDELARAIKLVARRTGKTFSQIIEQAARQFLKRPPIRQRRRMRLPVTGSPVKKLSVQALKRAMNEAELEYDLKQIAAAAGSARPT